MRTHGGPTRGSQRSKNGLRIAPQESILAIFGPLEPLGGPLGVCIPVYHFLQLPFHTISVKLMKICCQSELDGRKKRKKILVNFSYFWLFGAPLLGPRGLHYHL